MALALEDLEHGFRPGLPELAVRSHRVAEEEVARAGRQDRGRQPAEIAVDGRDQQITQIVPGCVERCRRPGPAGHRDEDVVDEFVAS